MWQQQRPLIVAISLLVLSCAAPRPTADPGEAMPLYKKQSMEIPHAVADAKDRLCDLIDSFDQSERAYLSRPHPGLAPRFSDYEQLARVAEWSGAGDSDE